MNRPISPNPWREVKVDDGNRQAIDDTLAVVSHIKCLQDVTADDVQEPHQVTTAIEAALGRLTGKQPSVGTEFREQFGFHIPPFAFADECYGKQFTVTTDGLGSWTSNKRLKLLIGIIHEYIDPQAKVIKIGYHRAVLPGIGANLTLAPIPGRGHVRQISGTSIRPL
jgi:hypothetical protein